MLAACLVAHEVSGLANEAGSGQNAAGRTGPGAGSGQVTEAPIDPAAVFRRAVDADLGTSGAPDAARAFQLYNQAAAYGLPQAALNVAVMYDSGRGVARSSAQAAVFYAAAAVGGRPRAAFDLAQLYKSGDGVPRNLLLADAWFHEAAEHGIAAAVNRLDHTDGPPDAPIDPPATSAPVPDAAIPPTAEGVALVWTQTQTPVHASYYVEVVDRDQPGAPVYTVVTVLSAALMPVPPRGHYAWRVFTLCASLGRYVPSDWAAFSVG